jgi:hypothetical protein
MVGKK